MNNFKIPYVVYAVVLGLMLGWLVSVIAGGIFVRPRPLPVVKARPVTKPVVTPQLTNDIITANIFALDLKPIPPSSMGDTASGQTITNPDGTVTQISSDATPPPPPFTAKLLGIVKDIDNATGIAIINVDNGTISIKAGEEKEGLKVVSLDEFSAIVEKERRKYTLVLEKGATAVAAKAAKESAQKTASTPPSTGTNINITLNRNEVRTELKDLNKILQSALVSPFYDKGEFMGYRVTRMRDDSPLRKLGLMPGDTITRINGNELKTPELLFNMLSQIDDISAISLDMIRNKEKKTVFVELQ